VACDVAMKAKGKLKGTRARSAKFQPAVVDDSPMTKALTSLLAKHGMTQEQAERNLLEMYNDLNATKFQNELPKKPRIKISWEAGGASASFKNVGPYVSIYVSPFCEPERYRRTMIHEMCHFYAEGHGEEFTKKLAEVAEGEPWLTDELKECKQWVIEDRIRSKWLHLVLNLTEQNPTMTWVEGRRRVAQALGVKIRDVENVAYDFKETWNQFLL